MSSNRMHFPLGRINSVLNPIHFNRIEGIAVPIESVVEVAFSTFQAQGKLILEIKSFPLSENQELRETENPSKGYVFSNSTGAIIKTSEIYEFEKQLKRKISDAYKVIYWDCEWNQPEFQPGQIDPDRVIFSRKPL